MEKNWRIKLVIVAFGCALLFGCAEKRQDQAENSYEKVDPFSTPVLLDDEYEYPLTEDQLRRYSTMLIERAIRDKKSEAKIVGEAIVERSSNADYVFDVKCGLNNGKIVTVHWDKYGQSVFNWPE